MLLDFLEFTLSVIQILDFLKGLIKQVWATLGLNVGTTNGKFTPAIGKPLAKHVHGEPACGNFNYSSVVGCFCILLVTHTLTLLMLFTVPQDICSAQSLCMNRPSSKLAII